MHAGCGLRRYHIRPRLWSACQVVALWAQQEPSGSAQYRPHAPLMSCLLARPSAALPNQRHGQSPVPLHACMHKPAQAEGAGGGGGRSLQGMETAAAGAV